MKLFPYTVLGIIVAITTLGVMLPANMVAVQS